MDHRLRNLMVRDNPLLIHRHDTAEGKPVFPGVQRTDPVGKPVREHRDHPVCQIHTGAPLLCLPVDRAVLLDIIRHVRYMDAQDITFPFLRKGNSVVQILGILPVNRHHLPAADILTPGHISLAHILRHTLRLVQYLLRKFYRQVVPSDN